MRLQFAAVAWMTLLGIAAGEETTFPYKASVTSNEVYVRSGPGKNYYPTNKLNPGDEVEVYRHDPGGWYAIRPTKGSYTWVSGRFLELTEDGLAKISADEVAARVGSEFSDIRDVIQVRLRRGEVVEVLDKKQFGSGPEAGTWYKIAPPSGEFRWIFGKYVDPDFPKDGIRKSSAENNPLLNPRPVEKPEVSQRVEPASADAAASGQNTTPQSEPEKPAPVQWSPAAVQAKPEPQEGAATIPAEAGDAANRTETASYATRAFHDPEDADASARPTRQVSPEEFQEQLDTLEMELSVMLVEEPTVWNFDEIGLRAKNLLLQAETAVERGRARTLLGKIAQSQDIQDRYNAVAQLRVETERENRQLAELSQNHAPAATAPATASRFDGQGRLARVVSPKIGAPQYALVDDNGKVQCYVTPAPGVNMQYYLGRRIGVSGVRGFIAEQRAQHVMAKNITPLDLNTTVR